MLLYVVYIYVRKKLQNLTLLEFLCTGTYRQSPNRSLIKRKITIGSVLTALGRNSSPSPPVHPSRAGPGLRIGQTYPLRDVRAG